MNRAIFTGILFLMTWAVFAQNATLKGKVITSDGKPAEFVSVILKGTNKGTVADVEGNYQLTNIKSGTYTIQVSFEKKISVDHGIRTRAWPAWQSVRSASGGRWLLV